MFRIGFGYDAHRLVEGRALILGGVSVSFELGLDGHSDADVLSHAIVDALLGALGKGDIGLHFPDTDPAYKGVSSLLLLKQVMLWVREAQYRLNNLDVTLVAQAPRLAPYFPAMKEQLAQVLETPQDTINLKAKTTEGMGFCGSGQGMEAFAVVSLIPLSQGG